MESTFINESILWNFNPLCTPFSLISASRVCACMRVHAYACVCLCMGVCVCACVDVPQGAWGCLNGQNQAFSRILKICYGQTFCTMLNFFFAHAFMWFQRFLLRSREFLDYKLYRFTLWSLRHVLDAKQQWQTRKRSNRIIFCDFRYDRFHVFACHF